MPRAKPLTPQDGVAKAIAKGDRIDVLRAMRYQLALIVDDCASPRDLSSITLRLSNLDKEIRAIEAEGDDVADVVKMAPKAWGA